ncbi:MAG: DoxX family protein [Stellaceae bacterium]
MNPNPVTDVIQFLTQPGWTTVVFWLLIAASIVIAVYAWSVIPGQRAAKNLFGWICRFSIGALWWQQTLWKLPPYYNLTPQKPFGTTGLAYWMGLIGKHAAIPAQADFVNHIVLPHFYIFAPIVYSLEVLTALSLILGLFVPIWGLIGAAQTANLWLGLYSAPGEWPWTYFFLMVVMLIFAAHRYGRALGLDAIITSKRGARPLTQRRRPLLGFLT